MADEWIRVASLDDVAPGTLLGVEIGDERICLANVDGEIYALRDNCSHQDFPLSAGELDDARLECAWHGARFDVRTGRALSLPAIRPVRAYEVKVEGGVIFVSV
ncbi:MAG TPA: non-heme iron oxygenase ferredoxin subunit [Longimicrobiales bacterium]|nr:non-heme iron oxygenase ferredoxin subunit [Longimicrobiales bacterium]